MSVFNVTIDEKRFESARGEDLVAISNLRFDIEENKFTCIVGPSGCGKTTALRIILGLESSYQGNVSALAHQRTAAVFQEPRLLPWRTVKQNVDLCVESSNPDLVKKTRETTVGEDGSQSIEPVQTSSFQDELLSLYQQTGLDSHLDFYPSELSLGLARRVAIARAFAIQPDLLVLDEPFVSLDDTTARRLRNLLITVWESRPTTVLMVTHNLQEAAELADKVVVLSARPSTVLDEINIATERSLRDSTELSKIVALIEQIQDSGAAGID